MDPDWKDPVVHCAHSFSIQVFNLDVGWYDLVEFGNFVAENVKGHFSVKIKSCCQVPMPVQDDLVNFVEM